MNSTINVRNIDPSDKAWLQTEAKRVGLSMESYVRKMIEERRAKTQQEESFMSLTTKYKPWLKHYIRKLPMLKKALRFLMAKSKFLDWKHRHYRRPPGMLYTHFA